MVDRDLALILTICDLLGKPALPAAVETKHVHYWGIVHGYREAQRKAEEAEK